MSDEDNVTMLNNLENSICKLSIENTIYDENCLDKYIIDFELDEKIRLELFQKYNNKNFEDAVELINRISGMYQFSGSKILESFLFNVCIFLNVYTIIKLEAAKGLLAFYENEEKIDSNDSDELKLIKKESNDAIIKRNNIRNKNGYKALDYVCYDLDNLPTPCMIEALAMLMESDDYKNNCNKYLLELINNNKINSDFRYKMILSLENKNIKNKLFYMTNACLEFIKNENNILNYRILSGQYLLQKCELEKQQKNEIQNILYNFAIDKDVEYDSRADSADTLLSLGDEDFKNKASLIITELGQINGKVHNIFENAQNVHASNIEKSVQEILNVLLMYPTLKIKDDIIDYSYVELNINKLIDNQNIEKNVLERIKLSLNRIKLDRMLYSNCTLSTIIVKLWSYIVNNKNKDEMLKRLVEELDDMSGTCSSGFLSRLINVITGFGEFNIYISFDEQIVANFSGRLNALARNITNKDSIFYTNEKALYDVVDLWLFNNLNIREQIVSKFLEKEEFNEFTSSKTKFIVKEYLGSDINTNDKIINCIEEFAENVLNEMMVTSDNIIDRRHFSLFFRTYMSHLREELASEFIGLVTESEFDLSFRRAISNYDGIRHFV
jgi:hypothetical protein